MLEDEGEEGSSVAVDGAGLGVLGAEMRALGLGGWSLVTAKGIGVGGDEGAKVDGDGGIGDVTGGGAESAKVDRDEGIGDATGGGAGGGGSTLGFTASNSISVGGG